MPLLDVSSKRRSRKKCDFEPFPRFPRSQWPPSIAVQMAAVLPKPDRSTNCAEGRQNTSHEKIMAYDH